MASPPRTRPVSSPPPQNFEDGMDVESVVSDEHAPAIWAGVYDEDLALDDSKVPGYVLRERARFTNKVRASNSDTWVATV